MEFIHGTSTSLVVQDEELLVPMSSCVLVSYISLCFLESKIVTHSRFQIPREEKAYEGDCGVATSTIP
jgi:hypothetical protein